MKILHSADFHADKDYNKFKKSFDQIKEYIIENDIDLFLFSGDLFDKRIFASELYNQIIDDFSSIADYCPILTVYGTPSHDYRGSLNVLRNIKRKCPIRVIDKIEDIVYIQDKYNNLESFTFNDIVDNPDKPEFKSVVAVVGLPWLLKYRFLTDEEMKLSLSEQDKLFEKKVKSYLKKIKVLNKNLRIPLLLVSHLQLIGSTFSTGQDLSSDNHDPEWFYDICELGLLGHIHKKQNFKNLFYSGSIYGKTWGELEDKGFRVIEIKDDKVISNEFIILDTPRMIKVDLDSLDDYKEFKDNPEVINDFKEVELWINLSVDNKSVLNYDKEYKFWNNKKNIINLRFDLNKIKTEISKKNSDYNINASLSEKFKYWCNNKKLEPNKYQLNLIKEIA